MTQNEYIDLLFGDYGFNTRKEKDWYISRVLKRPFSFFSDSDKLTVGEKSLLIDYLKDLKYQKEPKGRNLDG